VFLTRRQVAEQHRKDVQEMLAVARVAVTTRTIPRIAKTEITLLCSLLTRSDNCYLNIAGENNSRSELKGSESSLIDVIN
jgi:hypothetical protein